MNAIFTVGHSSLDWTAFQSLVQNAGIKTVVDVRSSPASRYFPHFNRAALETRLNAAGIAYVYLGTELGGRPKSGEPTDYERMAQSTIFAAGLDRIEQIASRSRLAICCAEQEPLECHRFLLVGRRLVERGAAVSHILRDGTIETHADTEERLLKLTRQTEADLFVSRAERLARAYRNQNHRLMRIAARRATSSQTKGSKA